MKKLILVSLAIGLFISCENERKNDPKKRSLQKVKVQFGYTIQSLPPNLQSGEDKVPQNRRNGIQNEDKKAKKKPSDILKDLKPYYLAITLRDKEPDSIFFNRKQFELISSNGKDFLTP